MKTVLSTMLLAGKFTACRQPAPSTGITGEWDAHSTAGGQPFVFIARFKADGTYDGVGNGKLVVSGHYRTTGNTILFRDAICNSNYEGAHKMTYCKDSVRFDLLQDTCAVRIEGTNGFGFKRKK